MISAKCDAAFADLVVDEGARYLEEGRQFCFFLSAVREMVAKTSKKLYPCGTGCRCVLDLL